jgi:hypothetical protein
MTVDPTRTDPADHLDRLAALATASPVRPAPAAGAVHRRVRARRRRRRTIAAGLLSVVVLAAGAALAATAHDRPDDGTRTVSPGPAPTPGTDAPSAPPLHTRDVELITTPMAAAPIGGREAAASVWTGTELLVWGGSDPAVLADGAAYDPTTNTWRTIAPSPLSARARATAVWTGHEMLVWGGSPTASGVSGLLDGAAYDPGTDTWRSIAPAPTGTDRAWGRAAVVGDHVVIAGGLPSTTDRTRQVMVYDLAADTWRTVTASDRVVSVAAVGDRVALVLTDESLHSVSISWLDPTAANVSAPLTFPMPSDAQPTNVGGAGAIAVGDRLVVTVSGPTAAGGAVAVMASLVPGEDEGSWQDVREVPDASPSLWPPNLAMSPVPDLLTSSGKVVVSATSFDDGNLRRTDLASGTIEVGVPPTGLCGTDAARVWTGTEVLVWGGQSCEAGATARRVTDHGARYRFPD